MADQSPKRNVFDGVQSLANLKSKVETDMEYWNNVDLTELTKDVENLDIPGIVASLNRNGNLSDELQDIRDLQRRYVHLSLFTSLSYVYITNILKQIQMNVQQKITEKDTQIADLKLKVENSEDDKGQLAELKAQITKLLSQKEDFEKLDIMFKQRVTGLSEFIKQYANEMITKELVSTGNATGTSTGNATGTGTSTSGGSKKKRGGFIRDGTFAKLAGEPYPK